MTLPEAAAYFDPPISARRLGLLIRALDIKPAGTRAREARPGHPFRTYDLGLLQDLHAAVAPFLTGSWQPRAGRAE